VIDGNIRDLDRLFMHAWNCQSQMDNLNQSNVSPTMSVMKRHPQIMFKLKFFFP
jgi:hypothetical protein